MGIWVLGFETESQSLVWWQWYYAAECVRERTTNVAILRVFSDPNGVSHLKLVWVRRVAVGVRCFTCPLCTKVARPCQRLLFDNTQVSWSCRSVWHGLEVESSATSFWSWRSCEGLSSRCSVSVFPWQFFSQFSASWSPQPRSMASTDNPAWAIFARLTPLILRASTVRACATFKLLSDTNLSIGTLKLLAESNLFRVVDKPWCPPVWNLTWCVNGSHILRRWGLVRGTTSDM